MKARGAIERWEAPLGWKKADGCTILGCGRPGIARGMCWNHYKRAHRGDAVYVYLRKARRGHQMVVAKFGPPLPPYSQRRMVRMQWDLKTLVTPEPNTGCWLWLGEFYPSEYGRVGNHRDPWGGYAHRAVVFFRGDNLERGTRLLHVRHTCNQPACVNPAHLVYGTAKENMADRDLRYVRGEFGMRQVNRKVTPALAKYIREAHALGVSRSELARDLGLTWQTVKRHVGSMQSNASAA